MPSPPFRNEFGHSLAMPHPRPKPSFFAALPSLLLLCANVSTARAADADETGAGLYESACAKCHSGGPGAFFTRAPKLSDKVWADRLAAAGSVEALVASVSRGKGKMPAQLGLPRSKAEPDSKLSQADLQAAVTYMLERTGTAAPASAAP